MKSLAMMNEDNAEDIENDDHTSQTDTESPNIIIADSDSAACDGSTVVKPIQRTDDVTDSNVTDND